MSTPIKSEGETSYNIYSPEDIQGKSRFISDNATTSKKSVVNSLEDLAQKLSDKNEIPNVLQELDENKLAEVNALNDPSTTNLFYRIKTQAVALNALAAYENSGRTEFPEDSTFEMLEKLQTLRTPAQVVWDCMFNRSAINVLKLRKVQAEAIAKSILAAADPESIKTPLIARAVSDDESLAYTRQYSTGSTISARDVEILEALENSKSFMERLSDCLYGRDTVKKAIAIAKSSRNSSFDAAFNMDSPMKQGNSVVYTRVRKL